MQKKERLDRLMEKEPPPTFNYDWDIIFPASSNQQAQAGTIVSQIEALHECLATEREK